jgi:hypothetical protein
MPLTINAAPPELAGTERRVEGSMTFDNSYVTGGEPFTARDLGLTSLKRIQFGTGVAGTTAYFVEWNRSVSAPTALAFQGDNANAAAGPATQVPNATNLSTLVVQFQAFGY